MAVLKKKTELPRKGETPLSLPFIHKSAANAPVVEKYPISFASLRWHYPNQVRSREYTLLSALFRELPCEAQYMPPFSAWQAPFFRKTALTALYSGAIIGQKTGEPPG